MQILGKSDSIKFKLIILLVKIAPQVKVRGQCGSPLFTSAARRGPVIFENDVWRAFLRIGRSDPGS